MRPLLISLCVLVSTVASSAGLEYPLRVPVTSLVDKVDCVYWKTGHAHRVANVVMTVGTHTRKTPLEFEGDTALFYTVAAYIEGAQTIYVFSDPKDRKPKVEHRLPLSFQLRTAKPYIAAENSGAHAMLATATTVAVTEGIGKKLIARPSLTLSSTLNVVTYDPFKKQMASTEHPLLIDAQICTISTKPMPAEADVVDAHLKYVEKKLEAMEVDRKLGDRLRDEIISGRE